MRNYRRNSPEAAGRIVALTLMADGHVCSSEIDALARAGAEARLGLAPGAIPALLRTLCEDLLASDQGAALVGADGGALLGVLDDVDDPRLQGELLEILAVVASADGHAADGESMIIDAARVRWAREAETLAA